MLLVSNQPTNIISNPLGSSHARDPEIAHKRLQGDFGNSLELFCVRQGESSEGLNS
jgi:hypothetical protein